MNRNNLDNTLRFLSKNNYKINVVYDLGANKGGWTKEYSQKINGASFIMFEANPSLKRPHGINDKHKWVNAVLSKPNMGTVEFYNLNTTGDSYYKEVTNHYQNVIPHKLDTITLDELVKTNKFPLPDFLKIDTQGSELDIFQGAKETIANCAIIMCEMPVVEYNINAPAFNEYIKALADMNFVPIGLNEAHYSKNVLIQVDVIFMRKDLKIKYYGADNFERGF